MANTRFKTENGLLVTGGNAQFSEQVFIGNTSSRANLTVDGELVLINGDLLVTGATQIVAGQSYTGDILAGVNGLDLGNTTNRFDGFFNNLVVYTSLTPVGNTLSFGNSTGRWVMTGNSLNLSTTLTIGSVTVNSTLANLQALNVVNQTNTATLYVTTSANVGTAAVVNTVGITHTGFANVAGSANVGGTLRVAGAANALSTLGITGAANALSTLGITGAANTLSTLGIGGAANALSTLGISGAANALSTLGVNGLLTAAAGLTVTGTTNASANLNVGGGVATTNGTTLTNTSIATGNSSINSSISPSQIRIINSVSNTILNANLLSVGNTANLTSTTLVIGGFVTVNSVGITHTGFANVGGTLNVTGAANTLSTLGIGGAANALSTFGMGGAANALSTFGIGGAANALSTLGVRGLLTASNGFTVSSGNVMITSTNTHYVSGNVSFNALYIDATNSRVGIGTTTPDTKLKVDGAANIIGAAILSNTLSVTGATTLANTLAITGAVTLSNTTAVTGTVTVGGGVAVANGITVTNTSITIGNTTSNVSLEAGGLFIRSTILGAGIYPTSNTVGSALGGSSTRWVLNANTGDFSGGITVNTAATLTIGTISTTTNGFSASNNLIRVGNSSVNVQMLPAAIRTNQSDSVTVPGFSWVGDTNLGVYRPAADTLGITTNGVERMRVNNSVISVNNTLQIESGILITGNTNAQGRRTIVATATTTDPAVANPSPQNGDIVYIY
jgi:hypothetical protein